MLLLLLALLGAAAPGQKGSEGDVLIAEGSKDQTVRGASAARLRAMLGAHAAGPPLDRAEVLSVIDARHPKIQGAGFMVEGAEGQQRMARGALDPVLSGGGKGLVDGYYGYVIGDATVAWDAGPVSAWAGYRVGVDAFEGDLPDYHGEYETLRGGEARVGLSVSLLEGLLRNGDLTRIQVAGLDLDAAQAERDSVVVLLRRKAVFTWAKWVAAGRLFALEQALLDIARQRQRAVDVRITLGDLASIERVRARQILAQREAALAEARGAFVAATEALALYLRDAEGEPVRVTDARLPDRVLAPSRMAAFEQDPIELARDHHPALIALRAQAEARRREARLARNGLLPDLALEVEHARDLATEGSTSESLLPPTTLVGLKAKVPLLNLKDRGKAAAAEAKASKAETELVWLEEQVIADVRSALAREEASLIAWRAAAETVDLALQLQDAEQRRFDAGDIDLLRLWQVEQSTAKAIKTEIKEWASYQIAVAELEAAVGRPMPIDQDGSSP